jgi:hypothetical protein
VHFSFFMVYLVHFFYLTAKFEFSMYSLVVMNHTVCVLRTESSISQCNCFRNIARLLTTTVLLWYPKAHPALLLDFLLDLEGTIVNRCLWSNKSIMNKLCPCPTKKEKEEDVLTRMLSLFSHGWTRANFSYVTKNLKISLNVTGMWSAVHMSLTH